MKIHFAAALILGSWVIAFNAGTVNGQAGPAKPAAAKPVAAKPEAAKPEAAKQEVVKPGAAAAAPGAGHYTTAQADRGQAIFKESCTGCHDTTRFTGGDFMTAWSGKPVHSLFEVMSTTMPEDNPGSLKPQQYADVLAYFLRLNKFPAGQVELKGSADAMKGMKIDKK